MKVHLFSLIMNLLPLYRIIFIVLKARILCIISLKECVEHDILYDFYVLFKLIIIGQLLGSIAQSNQIEVINMDQ
jgi:hypothetical protein